jgi:hypothetical protein
MDSTSGFLVHPVNDIQGNIPNFDGGAHPDIEANNMVLKKSHYQYEPQYVELIQCTPGETEDIAREIARRGYISAPTPYVVGLGVQHGTVLAGQYKAIVSLDLKNIFYRKDGQPCFLSLNWVRGTGLILSVANKKGQWIASGWWFAVIKK